MSKQRALTEDLQKERATLEIVGKEAARLTSEVEKQEVEDTKAAQDKIVDYISNTFISLEKSLSRPVLEIDIDKARGQIEQLKAALDEFYLNSQYSENEWIDDISNGLDGLEKKFKSVLSEIGAQMVQGEINHSNPIPEYLKESNTPLDETYIGVLKEKVSAAEEYESVLQRVAYAQNVLNSDIEMESEQELMKATNAAEEYESMLQRVAYVQNVLNSESEYTSATSGFSEGFLNSGNRILDLFRKLGYTVSTTQGHLKSFKSDVASNWGEAINSVIGLGRAITKNLGQKAISTLKPLGNALVGVSKSLLGISAFQSIGNSIGGLLSRIGKLASLAFVFRVITQGFRQLKKDIEEAFGTYLNYDSSLNSSINTLKPQFSPLKGQLASAFAPILQIIVPALSTFVGWCVSAANGVSALIAALTGRTSWKKAVVNSVGAVGDAASGASDALDDAADKADELKEKLGSYDKLNVIGDENKSSKGKSGSGGGGGSGSGKGADISYVDQTIGDGIRNIADWLKEMWEKADFTELGALLGQKLKDALDKIPWADIKQKAYNVGKSIATFLNGFFRTPGLGTTLGNTIAEFINTGLSAAYGFIHNFDFSAFGQFIVDGINAVITKLDFDLAAATLREGINGIFTVIKTATDPITGIRFDLLGDRISKFIEDVTNLDWDTAQVGFYNLGRGIADFANHLVKPSTLGALGSAVAECINTIAGAIKGFIDTANWEQYGQPIASFFNDLVSKVNWEQVGADFGGAIHGLLTTLREFISNLSFTDIANAFVEFFKGVFSELTWGDVATVLLSLLGFSIVKGVGTTLMSALAGLGTAVVSGIVNLIVGALPIVGAVAIIAALIYMLWNSVNKAIEDLGKYDWHAIGASIREFIVKGIDGVVNLALDFIANIKEGTKDIPVIGWIIGFIADGAELAVKVLGKLAKGDIIGAIWEWVTGSLSIIMHISGDIVKGVSDFINNVVDLAKKGWSFTLKLADGIAATTKPFINNVVDLVKKGWNWTLKLADGIATGVKTFISNVGSFIKAGWKWTLSISDGVAKGVTSFIDGVKGLWDKGVSFTLSVANGIAEGVMGFIDGVKALWDKGVSFVMSVTGDIGEGVQDVIDWAESGVNAVKDFACNIVGDVSEAITGFFSDKKEVFGDGTEVTLVANVEAPGLEESVDLAQNLQGAIEEVERQSISFIDEYAKQAQNAAKETGNWETSIGKTKESAKENALAMSGLADKYFDLAEKTNRTAGEEAQLRAIAEKLKETYPELGDAIDENTGLLNLNRDAVLNLIESRKQEAIMDALIEEYGKVSAAIAINNETLKLAESNYDTFKDTLKEKGWSDGTIKEFQDLGVAIKNGSTDEAVVSRYKELKDQLKELGVPQSEIDLIAEASTKMGELYKASNDMVQDKQNIEGALNSVAEGAAGLAEQDITLGIKVEDEASGPIEDVSEKRDDLNGNDAVFGVKAEDEATETMSGVSEKKEELGSGDAVFGIEATDNATPVVEGVKTEQETVATSVNTDYTATDNASEVASGVAENTNKVPDTKTVSFVDVGGSALAVLASLTIAGALALIPDEKKVTFSVENNTEEPIKTIKEALTGVQTHLTGTVAPAIKNSFKTTFSESSADAKNDLVGNNSINSAMMALKGHIETALGGIKRAFSTGFSEIHTAVREMLLNSSGIVGDFNTLRSNANGAISSLKSEVVSLFSAMRGEANSQISAIQQAINNMRGTTLKVAVTDEGTVGYVMQLISNIPTYYRVVIEAVWTGDQYRSFYANVYWENIERAIGGILRGHTWEDLPNVAHYAGGTARAHGTMFVAGENGAEVVGNINGHTEVLNKSQLAAAMYGSVLAAVARSGADIAGYIVQNIVSCTNVLVSAISSVPTIVQTLGGNLLNTIKESLSFGSEGNSEQTNILHEILSINRGNSSRITELIEAQKEVSPLISRALDFLNVSYEAQRQAHVESAQLSNVLNDLVMASNGERLIDLIINLDGRVIYEDMVQIDRGTQRITGRSGFAT